ncbi:MAG: hypothetical protein HPY89_10280 [Pelotomaculum sp.]|nr:hypothetical protein [Pelotomaculum sp.]
MKNCPVCSVPLDEIPKSGVLIDVCPKCKGVWLDRGELNRLLNTAREYYDEYEDFYRKHHHDYDDYHRHTRDHYKHGHYKKRGLFKMLEDIFD